MRQHSFAITLACLVLASALVNGFTYVGHGVYVGSRNSAGDTSAFPEFNVTAVVNVAWDLDIRYPVSQYVDISTTTPFNEHLRNFQYAKVGLVDGAGNSESTMVAAVLTLHQMLTVRTGMSAKNAAIFPQPVQRVLLHCNAGHSRSVTVGALYLHLIDPQAYATFDEALEYVKVRRNIQDNPDVPEPELLALARAIASSSPNLLTMFNSGNAPPPSPPGPTPAGSPKKSANAGVVVLALLLTVLGLFTLYCVVGIAVNRFRHQATGIEQLPHHEFWGGLFSRCSCCGGNDSGGVRLPAYEFS